jgi:N-acetyl-anhydromuramyl-L-alanine amidase AmpD
VESLGEVFAPTSRKASSNYGIGKDGRIGMYVEEKDRSWCSSNSANDHRAITIEVASDTKPPYRVNDAAYKALINLLVDICKRNDIKELKWKADKSLIGQVDKQNMTVHRWFANKSCPGDYLYNLHGEIAKEVNELLADNKASSQVKVEVLKLRKGSKGKNVEALQILLNGRGYNCGSVDGSFGQKTESAVKAFQKAKGLTVDGIVGTATWTALLD